jgi:glycosyltransferase involved in cell wall biosynthesis
LFSTAGGIQTFSQHFLDALSKEVGSERIRIVLKNDFSEAVLNHNGFGNVTGCGNWPRTLRSARFASECLSHAWNERPRLIVSTHLNFGPLARIIKQFMGIPYVLVAHGVEAWDVRRSDLQRALQHANRILAVSNYTRRRLLEEQCFDPCKVLLLPDTFDSNRFNIGPKPEYLLRRYGLSHTQPVILTVARLAASEQRKGYDNLLKSLPQVRREIPDVHYLIVGQGDDRPRIEEIVAQLGLQRSVTLAGYVPNGELCDHYNLCDVFAMPSKQEGLGIVYLEALACGKPTLGGNKDGAIDALCQGELGILVDPDNVEGISRTLIQILQGTYPHPILYKPEILRQKVINIYGFQQFKQSLSGYLEEFLTI